MGPRPRFEPLIHFRTSGLIARPPLQQPGPLPAPDQRVPPLQHAMVVEGLEEPHLALDPLAAARDRRGERVRGAPAGRLDPVPRALEGAAGRVRPQPLGGDLGPLPARDHPASEGPRQATLEIVHSLPLLLDPAPGLAERVMVLDAAQAGARVPKL